MCMLNIYKKATFKKVDRAALNVKLKKMVALYLLQSKNEKKQVICRKYWVHPIFLTEKYVSSYPSKHSCCNKS